jgi:single-strand DNA-binding protein
MTAEITVIGNVGKDPERRDVGSTHLASFSVAHTLPRKDKDGKKITEWYNCTVWGKPADAIIEYVHTGNQIAVMGELSHRVHEGKTYNEINVRSFTLLGGKSNFQQDTPPATDSGVAMADNDLEIPF